MDFHHAQAKVGHGGKWIQTEAFHLVPGDIISLLVFFSRMENTVD